MSDLPKADTRSYQFYAKTLSDLIAKGKIKTTESVLVICGGTTDFHALQSLSFENVTISNLDDRFLENSESPFEPYGWSYENGETLSFDDKSFDWVFVHAGLHHLKCPHKGIAEMYRVSKKGIVCFEPCDGLYTRLGVKLGFGQEYETSAVFANDLKWGGVENSHIPNFVYRLNKREFVKLISTLNPAYAADCEAYYSMVVPNRLYRVKTFGVKSLMKFAGGTLEWLGSKCSFLANNIALVAFKDESDEKMKRWLVRDGDELVANEEFYKNAYED